MLAKNNKLFIFRFILPCVLVLLVVYFYPVMRTITMSLFDVKTPSAPVENWNWVGLKNYQKLFHSRDFIKAYSNSIRYLVLGGLLTITMTIILGVLLSNKAKLPGRNTFNSLLYATVAVADGVGMAAPAAYVLSRYRFPGNGLIRRSLLTCLPIPGILIILPMYALLLYDIQGRFSLMALYACMRVPYSTIFLLNFFETISRTYEEAAAIDGCPNDKIFSKIMLPMVRPAIVTICLFGFIGILNEYMLCLLLIPSGNAMSLGVGLQRTIKALQYLGNYPGVFAAVLIALAPSLLIYAFCSRKIVFGGMGGGIKG